MKKIENNTTAKRSLVKDDEGANLVEYLILCGLVALACIVAWTQFGDTVESKVNEEGSAVSGISW
jgi:Flp pilus assembly pilin Flp